ncbi:MAG: lipoate--protein ligase [Tissierellia bacterium]|nr:lipoate--protein ligase [Tissierellia bacterium]
MKWIENYSMNPAFHHALEEYLLKETEEEIFILWRNHPTVLIGRNQNIYREVNLSFCQDHGIQVIRRLSGGGAIYTSPLSFQYSFITNEGEQSSFEAFAKPVIKALKALDCPCEFTGRNDILLDGKKISGNAQYHFQNKVLHHGSILFDANLEEMKESLKPNPAKFKKKNIDSVLSRIGLIKDYISMDLYEFRRYLIEYVKDYHQIEARYLLDSSDLQRIFEIQKERFDNPKWNYGRNPKTKMEFTRIHTCGILEFGIEIRDGFLDNIVIEGDFFGEKPIEELEDHLRQRAYTPAILEECLENIDVSKYIKGLRKEELLRDLLIER